MLVKSTMNGDLYLRLLELNLPKLADGFLDLTFKKKKHRPYEPGSKLPVLGMVIQPLIRNPYNGYINPYYWVDDHPLLYGNNGSLDPSTYI